MVDAIPRRERREIVLDGVEEWYFLGMNILLDISPGITAFAHIFTLGSDDNTIDCFLSKRTERGIAHSGAELYLPIELVTTEKIIVFKVHLYEERVFLRSAHGLIGIVGSHGICLLYDFYDFWLQR